MGNDMMILGVVFKNAQKFKLLDHINNRKGGGNEKAEIMVQRESMK
jgi:hypothetical protein